MFRMLLSLILAASGLLAQQEPVIHSEVRQVLVPVVVTDKKGRHVPGLHAGDFRVLEDGVPQQIQDFQSDTAASVNNLGALAKPDGETIVRRTVVICIDSVHTAPAAGMRLRQALEAVFSKEKQADVQYVLVGIGRRMQVLQAASSNPLALLTKVRSPAFQAIAGGGDASAYAATLANLRVRMDELCRRCPCGARSAQHTCDSELDALKQTVDSDAAQWTQADKALAGQFASVVDELAKLPTARTLILVSGGFSLNPANDFYALVSSYLPNQPRFRPAAVSKPETTEIRKALQTAADRNVVIDALDAGAPLPPSLGGGGPLETDAVTSSGPQSVGIGTLRNSAPSVRASTLQSAPHQTFAPPLESALMRELAETTGGVYYHAGDDLQKPLRSVLSDGREYYLLSYTSKNSAQDGKFRRILVELANPAFTVRAKSGYWAEPSAQ